jgi:hypothetical protein
MIVCQAGIQILYPDFPTLWYVKSVQVPGKGGFPGSIGSNQGYQLPPGYLEIYSTQCGYMRTIWCDVVIKQAFDADY